MRIGMRVLAAVGMWTSASASAQSLTGTTGLVSVPTAQMPADGTVSLGVNVIDRHYIGYGNTQAHAGLVQFVSVAFLPFAEVGLRLTRMIDHPRPQALGDRMVSVRVRVLEEGAWTPALVAGVHDLVGTRIFHAQYLVASRAINGMPLAGDVSVHLGYGAGFIPVTARSRQFVGLFGGVSAEPHPWVTVLLEHDAERVNAGVRLRLLTRIHVLAAAHGLDAFSGGIGYTHQME